MLHRTRWKVVSRRSTEGPPYLGPLFWYPCLLFSGLLTAYVPGKLGLVLNLISLLLHGFGVSHSSRPSFSYFMVLVLQNPDRVVLSPAMAANKSGI